MIDHVQNWKNYYLEDRDSLPAITPPATNTPSPGPATETPSPSATMTPSPSATATRQPSPTATPTQSAPAQRLLQDLLNWLWILAIAAVAAAGYFAIRQKIRKNQVRLCLWKCDKEQKLLVQFGDLILIKNEPVFHQPIDRYCTDLSSRRITRLITCPNIGRNSSCGPG